MPRIIVACQGVLLTTPAMADDVSKRQDDD